MMRGLKNPFCKWYAKDDEYYIEDPVQIMRDDRSRRAALLWKYRRYIMTVAKTGALSREYLENAFNVPTHCPRPTAEELYRRAWHSLEASGWHNGRMGAMDTEYYSACGWDDACAERARAHKVAAVSYIRAARKLKWAQAWGYGGAE